MTESTQAIRKSPVAAAPGDLGWHLGMVLRGYQSRFEEAVEGMPAGIRGYQILSTVIHRDPPNQQSLGSHLAIDRTVLTYLLDSLVDAGMVDRVPAPSDRRARKIVATEMGLEILAQYEERVATAESGLLSGLKDSEAETLVALIARLAMNVHRSQPGSSPCEAMDHLP
ncbi:DNA-binding MarR family transcriptional regulator [Arthrobacter sp. SLBN-100]|uniref:MarR family winged helix-turn-helix transcriptional regulator n=1 Tax=Arthrobacter sp. SLBN-100 TaxID=2768450 RepID=UPI00115358D7|nr:MarR family transcriptional regulator [Arthrobacter sp. SLBN-100]TQJ62209.1 DNA-binding MarR family transcriptional regulator [Arthrobacter sp. SLBN-100]